MPRWWVSEPYIDLWMSDTPLSYTMSSGNEMAFTFFYKQGYTLPHADQIPGCRCLTLTPMNLTMMAIFVICPFLIRS